jgi:hypothetical protein
LLKISHLDWRIILQDGAMRQHNLQQALATLLHYFSGHPTKCLPAARQPRIK